jgi:hypothetical protein
MGSVHAGINQHVAYNPADLKKLLKRRRFGDAARNAETLHFREIARHPAGT